MYPKHGSFQTPIVMVIGKIRDVDSWAVMDNIKQAADAAEWLWLEGYAVITPHLMNCIPSLLRMEDHPGFLDFNLYLIETIVDVLFVLSNYHASIGSLAEIECGKKHGKIIIYSRKEMELWRKSTS